MILFEARFFEGIDENPFFSCFQIGDGQLLEVDLKQLYGSKNLHLW
jgi:hypothetical protein